MNTYDITNNMFIGDDDDKQPDDEPVSLRMKSRDGVVVCEYMPVTSVRLKVQGSRIIAKDGRWPLRIVQQEDGSLDIEIIDAVIR